MVTDKASMTALGVAYLRAWHCRRHEPKVFSDTCAWDLITDEERDGFADIVLDAFARHRPDRVSDDRSETLDRAVAWYAATSLVVARSAFSEQCLRDAIDRGVDQYVIVGAGMDTFAVREPAIASRIRIFEIDHPATQAFKRERTAFANHALPANLYFAPADFERDTVATALSRTPFDADRPGFFAWHGVTMYLTGQAIAATLESISGIAAPGSEIVFDYWDAIGFDPFKRSREVSDMFELVAGFGEPFVSGFEPAELGQVLAKHGFALIEDLGPQEQMQKFFEGRADGIRPFDIARIAHARVT
jgi:methyltransferase (TIGR00027 family)